MWIVLGALVAFIVLSGIAAAVDAAVLSISRAEVEELVVEHRWAAGWLKQAKIDLGRTIVVVVIVTNTINVLGPIVVGELAASHGGQFGLRVATAAMILGTIVFSEIVPKSLGAHYAPFVGRLAAPALVGLTYALYPLVIVLDGLSQILRRPGARPLGTEAQIRALVVLGSREAHIEGDEARMIQRAFVLNDRTTGDLATPLDRVVALRTGDSIEFAAEVVADAEFSRYPVFGHSTNDVRGFVLGRDVLCAGRRSERVASIDPLIRTAPLVPRDLRSDALLALFRDERVHIAVVRDGERTIGIVTLEDVLEQLVGRIDDEKDAE